MTESQALRAHRAAYTAWEANPNWFTASENLRCASRLVAISDDYTSRYDEACDIMDDTVH